MWNFDPSIFTIHHPFNEIFSFAGKKPCAAPEGSELIEPTGGMWWEKVLLAYSYWENSHFKVHWKKKNMGFHGTIFISPLNWDLFWKTIWLNSPGRSNMLIPNCQLSPSSSRACRCLAVESILKLTAQPFRSNRTIFEETSSSYL